MRGTPGAADAQDGPGVATDGGAFPPGILTAILLPQDRIAREPLGRWAERLSQRLARVRAEMRAPRALAHAVGAIGNNAALIAAHAGASAAARGLCERQMAWQLRLARRSRDRAITAHAVQPWVNLARLQAQQRDCAGALERLAALRRQAGQDALVIGCARVRRDDWEVMAPGHDAFASFMENVFVLDSLKALLLNRRWDETLDFAAALPGATTPPLARFGAEAYVVASMRLGDAERARATAQAMLPGSQTVFPLRLAEVHACEGRRGEAARLLVPLARLLRDSTPEQRADLQTLHVMNRVAGACAEAGEHGEARALGLLVRQGAETAGDEVIRIESLRLLAALSSDAERGAWDDALAAAEETTEYVRYRRGGPAPPAAAVEHLLQHLHEVFAS
ncbi:hypothetical protein [Longimicrobium sp.]|uniref:hypothetical protein n=1 Tax=Longimicrobium sp. TaxID=2029185 RepID=UPI002BAAC93A|nr:hypothetical protein [Longimicrobium sp.]HSU17021.1 hypothetical protein [Longimicrobium sp.]